MTPPAQIDWNLKGKRIAVPEMRELEVFSGLLERRGAEVLRCPLVTIYDSPHSAAVLAFAVRVAEGNFDDFVLITGEGLTRILSCIDKHDPSLRPRFVEGLAKLRTVTRGPKPARALRVLGLKPGIEATEPTTEGVIRALSTHPLEGRRVAVQLYGNDPNLVLMRFLRDNRRTSPRSRRTSTATPPTMPPCMRCSNAWPRAKWTPSHSPANCRSSGW